MVGFLGCKVPLSKFRPHARCSGHARAPSRFPFPTDRGNLRETHANRLSDCIVHGRIFGSPAPAFPTRSRDAFQRVMVCFGNRVRRTSQLHNLPKQKESDSFLKELCAVTMKFAVENCYSLSYKIE